MTWAILDLWVLLPLLLSGVTLVLLGWELGPRRRPAADSDGSRPRARLRGAAHKALEIHLMLWVFFASVGLLLSARSGSSGTRLIDASEAVSLLLFVLAVPVALALTHLGKRVSVKRDFPVGLRWILAPYHGLSIWLLLLFGSLRALGKKWRRSAGPTPAEEAPDSVHEGVRELDSLTLEEVLIPRSQEVALKSVLTPRDALLQVAKTRHKLYPVYGDSVDQLLGVVRMLDLAHPKQTERLVRDLVVPVPIVPETMNGVSLLGRLGGAPVPVALVVDEFGSHAGFVSVEDLVEVLVGDLVGEHEVVQKRIREMEPGVFKVEGTCEIEEFNGQVADVLPEGEYETVAGLFLDRVGRIPQTGDELQVPGAELEVLERTERRVLWVKITLAGSAE